MLGVAAMYVLSFLVLLLTPYGEKQWPWPDQYTFGLVVALLFLPFIFQSLGLYRAARGGSLSQELIRAISAWVLLLTILLVLTALSKVTQGYSRAWFVLWLLSGAVWLTASRIVLRKLTAYLHRAGVDRESLLLVGDPEPLEQTAQILSRDASLGFYMLGYCGRAPMATPALSNQHYLGDFSALQLLTAKDVDQIWLVFRQDNFIDTEAALDALSHTTATIRLVPDFFSRSLLHVQSSMVAGLTLLDLNYTPLGGINRIIKSVEDYFLAVLLLILTAPLLVMIAVGIKYVSPGPVLFRQYRHGWHGRRFGIFKFRTMHVHQPQEGQVTQASRNDQRVFPFGAWLRRYSLDELPQLFNVLGGSMSLIGPRPHPEQHNEHYQKILRHFMWRHTIKPGMTGWAQVHGFRGETPTPDLMQRRLEHDLYYAQNWTFWLDMEILVLTAFGGFTGPNAY